MSIPDLFNGLAVEGFKHPERPLLDMGAATDVDLINSIDDDRYGDSAVAELVKRANGKHVTLFDYILPACLAHHSRGGGGGGGSAPASP
jgi:hypothetical protein